MSAARTVMPGTILRAMAPAATRAAVSRAEARPPQPMVAQTRAVLDGYAAAGGRYREVVIDDAGHGPHLEQPQRFLAELNRHLSGA